MRNWDTKDGTPAYEKQVRSFLIALRKVNRFLDKHPEKRGLFEGQKGKSQNKQRL